VSVTQLLLCLFLISTSAFLSGSEVALFSLSRFQLRILKDKFKNTHRKIRVLLSDPPGLLLSLLLTNEIVNISLSSIMAHYVTHRWSEGTTLFSQAWVVKYPSWALQLVEGIIFTAPIVLILCEMTPKALGAKLNFISAPLISHPIYALYRFFEPLRWILFPDPASKPKKEHVALKEEEFLTLVEQGHQEGSIHHSEMELIKNVFDLDDTAISEIYIPLAQTATLSAQLSPQDAIKTIKNIPFSRVPLTNGKEIIGIVYKKDLILSEIEMSQHPGSMEDIMRAPLVVSPQMQINTLFRQFRQTKTHFAVVKDPVTSKTLGIVTMKDVLTELFEDLLT